MYEFIVLGLIPGTQTQITFEVWLEVVALLLLVFLVRTLHRAHTLRTAIIVWSFMRLTRRDPLVRA